MIRKNKKFIDPRYFMEEKVEGGALDQLDEMAFSAGALASAESDLDANEKWQARYDAWNLYQALFNEFHKALEEAGGYQWLEAKGAYYSRPIATMWRLLWQEARKFGMVSSEPQLSSSVELGAGGQKSINAARQKIKDILVKLVASAQGWLDSGVGAMKCDGTTGAEGHCKLLKTAPAAGGGPELYFTQENLTTLTGIIDKIGSVSQPGAEATQEAP